MKNKTLIFFIDAVREDYITQKDTPFLYAFKKKHTYMDVESLLGYSSGIHPTIRTGLYQEEHNYFLVYSYDPKNSPFKRMKYLGRIPKKLRQFILASLKAPYYMLPFKKHFPQRYKKNILPLPASINPKMAHFFSNESKPYNPEFFSLLEKNNISYSSQPDYNNKIYGKGVGVDNRTITDKDVDYYFVYETDPIGHYSGPRSEEMKKKMKQIDTKIQQLVTESEEKYGDTDIFLFSDHGMVEITGDVNVKELLDTSDLVPLSDYVVFYDSTMVRFRTEDEQVKQKIISLLSNIPHLTYLDEALQEKYKIRFNTRKRGDIMFLADPGYRIFPDYFAPVRFNTKGMHGYRPDHKEGMGVFMTNTFTTKKKSINVVDFMPTMLKGIGKEVLIPKDISGKPVQ